MVPSPGEYKLENADNGKANQQHWHIILFKVKWPSIQKIFRFCLFRLVELTRLKLATTRKEERERSINSIISPSLPSAVLPCFLPILSHHYVYQLKSLIMKLLPDVTLQLFAFSSYPPLNCLFQVVIEMNSLYHLLPQNSSSSLWILYVEKTLSGCSGAWTTLTSWWSDPQRALEGWLSPSSRWRKWRWGLPSSTYELLRKQG